ncbi:SRPBCC family protein [Actinomycetospora termitidis]|uniref:SRPBCC family protein n=1 Tax=Actinomycetospora termitidis TaxID=3053470 RepID=A0ABT7MI71_9PSEU|nr:SRPBCC family protein [Actinomycetospora sp. Odt1-22]MDL5159899.1 SRPBCC family protein [Actinomycetospora sp. Odt1-22]
MPHVSTVIARPWREVYAYAADPAHLPSWAAGLSTSTLTPGDDGWWTATGPLGTVRVRFCERNEFGVLDHVVRLPDGTEVLNPLRVVPWGDVAEVVFSVRPREGMSDADVEADVAAVTEDLATLKGVLESA